jgi:hypothetical protein
MAKKEIIKKGVEEGMGAAKKALDIIKGPASLTDQFSNPHYANLRLLDKNVSRGRLSLNPTSRRAGEGKTELYSTNVLKTIQRFNPSFNVKGNNPKKIFDLGDEMINILKNHPNEDLNTIKMTLEKQPLEAGILSASQFAKDLAKIKKKNIKK